jgi:hypothetical protein
MSECVENCDDCSECVENCDDCCVCEKNDECKDTTPSDRGNNLKTHAINEFNYLGWPGEDEIQKMVCDDVLELLQVFSEQGHSESSALYILNIFDKVARFGLLSPLTGNDDEWMEVSNGVWQNKRCYSVFKTEERGTYWIDGKVFREPNGCTYTSRDSFVDITFPWVQSKSEIVDVPMSE